MQLSQTLEKIPKEEKRRLERRLGIILRGGALSHETRKALVRIFEDLEERLELELEEGNPVWQALLDHMGQLPVSNSEASPLKDHPIAFFPAENLCAVPDEALEALSRMRAFRNLTYLFCEIARLSPADRKAYSRWLGLEKTAGWLELYHHCAAIRRGQREEDYSALNEAPLESVFPSDVMGPLFWFYKGVLPLYESARLAYEQITEANELQKLALDGLRTGHVVARQLPDEFGQRQRYVLRLTREKNIGLHTLPPQYTEEPLQRNLF